MIKHRGLRNSTLRHMESVSLILSFPTRHPLGTLTAPLCSKTQACPRNFSSWWRSHIFMFLTTEKKLQHYWVLIVFISGPHLRMCKFKCHPRNDLREPPKLARGLGAWSLPKIYTNPDREEEGAQGTPQACWWQGGRALYGAEPMGWGYANSHQVLVWSCPWQLLLLHGYGHVVVSQV